MNRRHHAMPRRRHNKPHARGDEPDKTERARVVDAINPTHVGMNRGTSALRATWKLINPTHVGMNRRRCTGRCSDINKPHARGDEPDNENGEYNVLG